MAIARLDLLEQSLIAVKQERERRGLRDPEPVLLWERRRRQVESRRLRHAGDLPALIEFAYTAPTHR